MQIIHKRIGGRGGLFMLIQGDSRTGKTSFATNLPDRFYPLAYAAWDPKSEGLKSTFSQNLNRILPVKPGRLIVDEKAIEGLRKAGKDVHFDAETEEHFIREGATKDAERIATYPWSAEELNGERIRTLVWDTATQTSDDILNEVSIKGFTDKNTGKEYGQHRHSIDMGGGKKFVGSNQPDYGLAQKIITQILKYLADQPINVFVLFHKEIDADTRVIGPATIGRALVAKLPRLFDYVVETEIEPTKVGNETKNYHHLRVKSYVMKPTMYKVMLGMREGLKDPVFTENRYLLGIDGASPRNNPADSPFWICIQKLIDANEGGN